MSDSVRGPALSVVIATRTREASLIETLRLLGDHDGTSPVEVVVIDNDPSASLTVRDLPSAGFDRIRLLSEPRPGKAAALNRAFASGGLAPLVAILDDDMTPAANWCSDVVRSAARRPTFDIFAGRSHAIWPDGVQPPRWIDDGLARGIACSVIDLGPDGDREMGVGGVLGFPSGNHLWFRRTVLTSTPRVPEVWPPMMEFVLRARTAGHRGVFVPEVVCGHRLQSELLDLRVVVERAGRVGAALARLESIERRGMRRPTPTLLSALGRGCGRLAAAAVLRTASALLPRDRRVPASTRFGLAVGRERTRVRLAAAELTGRRR